MFRFAAGIRLILFIKTTSVRLWRANQLGTRIKFLRKFLLRLPTTYRQGVGAVDGNAIDTGGHDKHGSRSQFTAEIRLIHILQE